MKEPHYGAHLENVAAGALDTSETEPDSAVTPSKEDRKKYLYLSKFEQRLN